MRTIRWKFVSAFIIATAAIMIVVLGLFNIVLGIYFERNARVELQNTFSTMNVLIEKQLLTPMTPDGKIDDTAVSNALVSLSTALTASRITGNTEIFIFDDQFALKYPEPDAETMLNDELMEKIRGYDFTQKGQVESARLQKGVYFLAGMTMETTETGRIYVVFVLNMNIRQTFFGMMNVFLASIMAVALGIGAVSAMASARSLTRPIKEVCRYAREIGNGNFLTIPPDTSSLETSALVSDINEMSQRLKAVDQAQKLFLQNASHELRTPLMSIQGYSEAIEQGIVSQPKEAAAIIRAESIRLTALVEELIKLSKMDSSIYDRAFGNIDLGETLTDCIDRLNGLAIKAGKSIQLAITPGVMIRGEDTLLNEVFGNVVSNCLRYAKSTVTVKLERALRQAVVTITDDGDGITPEDIPHLFERFYKGKGGQFGLGLAIAKKALELLDGTIEARNCDVGAVFIIRLPVLPGYLMWD